MSDGRAGPTLPIAPKPIASGGGINPRAQEKMAPETRSRGTATPARVYHSSPALQQVQFPARRRKVLQTYGRQTPTGLRQQTLTQIDFVSSFEDRDVFSSPDQGRNKENKDPETAGQKVGTGTRRTRQTSPGGCELTHQEGEPVLSGQSRGKRKAPRAASSTVTAQSKRRRTLGHVTNAAAEAVGVDDGGHGSKRTAGGSPASPRFHTQTLTQFLGHRMLIADSEDDDVSLTAASDVGPDDGFLDWLDGQASPSRPPSVSRRGQGEGEVARLQSREESVIPQTPLKRVPAIRSASPPGHVPEGVVGRYGPSQAADRPPKDPCPPMAAQPAELLRNMSQPEATTPTSSVVGSPVTPKPSPTADGQAEDSSLPEADGGGEAVEARTRPVNALRPGWLGGSIYEIPDSEDEADEADQADEEQQSLRAHGHDGCGAGAGAETPLAMQRGQSSAPPGSTAAGPVPDVMPLSPPLESQRVPMTDLQSLPPHTPRSDILLPVATTALDALVTGRCVDLEAVCKIPGQVVRLWLLDRPLLRYVACVDGPARPAAGAWRYRVCQMYELNNPVGEQDMRLQGWLHGLLSRYAYLPPAVVGQLLWNLRRALFVPRPPPPSSPSIGPPSPAPLPSSQATTASQPSTPDRRPPASSSSLVFLDHGASHATLSSLLLSPSQCLPDSLLRDLPSPDS